MATFSLRATTPPPPRRLCFVVPGRLPADPGAALPPLHLPAATGDALAILLSLLGCGEEAAANAFDALGALPGQDGAAAAALARIAAEERVHDALLRRLRAALPATPRGARLLAQARRFHIDLAAGGAALHFARIAALDAAVCLVLTRLLRRDGAIAAIAPVRDVLTRIRADEARHVAIARRMAHGADPAAMRAAARDARRNLAAIFRLARAEFAILGVDPDRLIADVERLPPGLIAS